MALSVIRLTATSLFVSLLALPAIGQDSPTLTRIRTTGVINLGHREASVPFSYLADQKVVGYSHELALKVLSTIKADVKMPALEVKLLPVTTGNRISLVESGAVDLECGTTTHTLDREQRVAFSTSIFVVGTKLMVRKKSNIKDYPDLKGKSVVTTGGGTSELALRTMNDQKKMGMTIIQAKNDVEASAALESGRAEAYMMDDALLYSRILKSNDPSSWKVVGKAFSTEAYGCMMQKGDPVFKKLVDDTLTSFLRSPEAPKLYAKWFMQPVPPNGINLRMPLSDEMKALFKNPTDRIPG